MSVAGFLFCFAMTIINTGVEIKLLRKQLAVEFDLECDGSYMNIYCMESEKETSEKKGDYFKKSHIF